MSPLAVRFVGSLSALGAQERAALLTRTVEGDARIPRATAEVIGRVRESGDAALLALTEQLDGVKLAALEVPPAALQSALEGLAAPLRQGLERAARNITCAHRAFLPKPVEVETEPGIVVGRRPDPLVRVGVYAPGGRAAYPSSVLMGAIPARVAGVEEVVLCSPPQKDGLPSPVVLAAAALAGVQRVFAVGGAQAIAALAFGTASIPRVQRIVGPGNAYVVEAKRQVAGEVGIDSPAGPSELLTLVDDSADPAAVARELLAQAEHDPAACVVALCLSEAVRQSVQEALERQADAQPRREVIAAALASRGGLLTVESLEEAVAFANAFCAEHLLLAVRHADRVLPQLRGAGTVFLGEQSSVAFGDYLTGSNHVLPTGGKAAAFSGLSTQDFMRWTSYQRVTRDAASRLAWDVRVLAESEGLFAHAAAGSAWGGVR
jgi:histidinol dehydrogenase